MSFNLFAYCNNNPVIYSDQTGTLSLWALAAYALATITAIASDHLVSQKHPEGYCAAGGDVGNGFSMQAFYAKGSGANVHENGFTLCDFDAGLFKLSYDSKYVDADVLRCLTAKACVDLDLSGYPSFEISSVASLISTTSTQEISVLCFDITFTEEIHYGAIGYGVGVDLEELKFKASIPRSGVVVSGSMDIDYR